MNASGHLCKAGKICFSILYVVLYKYFNIMIRLNDHLSLLTHDPDFHSFYSNK